MSAEPGYAFQAGRILAGLHYKIVPIGPGKKYPPIQAWQEAATDDLVQVAQWLAETNYGIGWAMGLQPNGKHLFCLDIDGDLGAESLGQLILEHGSTDTFTVTCQQQTGSGGWHYIFESEFEVRNSASQFAPGIDIRGEGGQIVVGPTIHPNGQAYRWVKGPKRNPPQMAPAWVMDRIAAQETPQVPSLATVPVAALVSPVRADDGETPFDWLNRTFDSQACLLRLGWLESAHRAGLEIQFTRPGKDPRQGTSATLHTDTGAIAIFSTTLDPIYHQVGLPGRGCVILKPADLWMVENGITDRSEASRMIRAMMPQGSGAAPAKVAPDLTVQGDSAAAATPSRLNLPDEFWQARGYLTQIRDAAWSTSCSPDAVFAAVMARYSANLHPSIMLPQWGTLDLFVVIAGHSGAYKSKAGKTARQLFPGFDDSAVLMDRNVGSGEGLAEAFFEWRDEEGFPCGSSKKGAVKVKTRWGLHFSTDESTALAASAARAGAIVIQTLCQAWMGEAIGQLLADPTKSRMIEPNQVRVSAELKIQTIHGHKLFAEEYASTGLAQRMVCFTSLDASIHERFEAGTAVPEWPGELTLPRPFVLTGGQPRILELSPAITRHLAAADAAGHNPAWAGDPLDTHANLSRLKIAAILSLMDDRFSVSDEDWELAGIVMDSHRTVRTHLQATKKAVDLETKVTIVTTQIEREVGVEDGKHKALLRRAVAAIQARIVAEKPLGKKYMSGPQRDVYEEAMALLEVQGLVRELPDGGWVVAD